MKVPLWQQEFADLIPKIGNGDLFRMCVENSIDSSRQDLPKKETDRIEIKRRIVVKEFLERLFNAEVINGDEYNSLFFEFLGS